MLFSVIIPTHNRAHLIATTLESVLSQTETDREIIVVDDGSTDSTRQVLGSYAQRVSVIEQTNAGPGAARNRGAAAASGRYLCFLDSDDQWFPWTLEVYRKAIESCGEPALLLGRAFEFENPAKLDLVRCEPLETESFPDFFSTSGQFLWHGCSVLVIRSVLFHQMDGFTDRHINGEDTDLWLRSGTGKGFVRILSPVTAGYRRHAASAIGNIDRSIAGMFYLIEQERAAHYPGGKARQRERWRMLSRHLRPATFQALAAGRRSDASRLFVSTLKWNLLLGRVRYLLAFAWRWIF